MKRELRWVLSIMVGLMIVGWPVPLQAQTDPAYEAELRRLYDDPSQFEQLSGAARSLLERKFGRRGPPAAPVPRVEPTEAGEAPLAPATVTVNNPDATAQDTQSETGVLAVGSTVVSAYNDSGSCLPVCGVSPGNKFTGYSRSTNGGASFSDMGTLPTATGGDVGDPVLARSDTTGAIFLVTLRFSGTGLQCFRSTDTGATWLPPSNCGPGSSGFQDKPWITVDNWAGTGNGNVYVAWSDFGSTPGIRFARSTDGGATYLPSPGTLLWSGGQGANVVVGTNHHVYVFSWQGTTPQSIQMRKSTDLGLTFSSAVTVAADLNTTGVNGDLALAGGFRSNSFPQAAVSPSGDIYVAYNRIFNPMGNLQDTDIRLRRSTDGGATWTGFITPGFSGATDWSPSIAVAEGLSQRIMLSWYQKPSDGTTTGNIIHRKGTFVDGVTFTEIGFGDFNITTSPFPIVINQDPVVDATYMGDYDQPDADSTYFYQTWGDNSLGTTFHAHQPDVRFSKYYVFGAPGTNVAAVLPLSRSHTLGSGVPPTAFAAIINAGDAVAANCRVAAPSSPPTGLGAFTYHTTNSSNALIGTPNTPANIAPGAIQNFVFGFAPTGEIAAGTSLAMRFLCDNVTPAAEIVGVNNFIIGVSSTPIPDPIALVSTISNDGVVRIPGPAGTQLFAIGTSNVGATGTITVAADTGGVSLPLTLMVCETTGGSVCLAPPTSSVTVTYGAGENRSFAFFATASGSIPFVPQTNRVFPRLTQGSDLRGATSAAVCTVGVGNGC